MPDTAHPAADPVSLARQVRDRTGESVDRCYQCGKCTAGCPLAGEMDIPPSAVLRLLQSGLPRTEEEVLDAYSIWLCVACEACSSRCPQQVDIPRIMEHLRRESLRRGLMHPKAKDILSFQRSFLDSVRYTGRLHEVSLVAAYKLRTRHLLQDVGLVPKLLARGKLSILPDRIEDRAAIGRMFARATAEKADEI